jgi:hypothetical protein
VFPDQICAAGVNDTVAFQKLFFTKIVLVDDELLNVKVFHQQLFNKNYECKF